MRLEIELSDGGGGPAPELPPPPTKPRRAGLDRFEISVLAVFSAISVFVLALDLWRVVFDGAVWTGTDGVYIVDANAPGVIVTAMAALAGSNDLRRLRSYEVGVYRPGVKRRRFG